MSINSNYFTSENDVNLKRHINTRNSVLHVQSNILINFVKATILLLITFFNMPSLQAAKDNLYNATTFAGSGTAGYANGTGTSASFNNPGNIIINSATGDLYVVDWSNYVIRKITASGVVSTLAGIKGVTGSTDGAATVAKFSKSMRGIACDSSGNLYLADYSNNAIRKITPTGTVSTFSKITGVLDVTVDSSNTLYATSISNDAIYKISSNGTSSIFAGNKKGSTNGIGTAAKFNTPAALATNSSNIYVADYNNNLVRKITASNGTVTTIAGGGSVGGTTSGSANGSGTTATFNKPVGIYFDKSGNLYVADQSNNLIRKITSAGVVTTITSSKNDLRLNTPRDVVLDNTGAIYIAELGTHRILKLTPNYIGSGTTDTVLTSADYGTYESINLAGGTMQAAASDLTIANNIMLATGTTSTVDMTSNAGYNLTLSGLITGSGSLVQSGTGTLTLSNTSNSYTGGTTVSSGILNISNNGNNQCAIGTGTLTLAGGTVQASGAWTPITVPVNLSANSVVNTLQSKDIVFYGVLSGSGTLTKAGPGQLTLGGTNTNTGEITISAGALTIGAGSTTGSIGPNSVVNNGTLNFARSNDYTYAGVISGSGALIKYGTNTLTLSGENTYTGITTIIQAGTLQIGAGGTTGSIISNVNIDNGRLNFNRSNAYTYAGIIAGAGSLTKSGSGTLTLTGANTYTGATTIGAGTLIGDISKSANVTITGTYNLNGTARTLVNPSGTGAIKSSGSNAALTINSTVSADFKGVIDNTISGVTLTGSGKFGFAKDQRYTGITTINDGAWLQISTGSTTGSIASTSIVNNGKISFTRSDPYTYAGVISGTGSLHQYKLNTLTLTETNTYTGATTIDAGGTLQIGSGSTTGSITSTSIVNSGKISFNRSDAYTYAGVISGTGSVQQKGTGTLTLSNTSNSYTGGTTVSSGTLDISNNGNNQCTIGTGTLTLAGGTVQASAASTPITVPVNLSANSVVNTLESKDIVLYGVLSGSATLTKTGPGQLTLGGTNTNTGVITISAGTLTIGAGGTTGNISPSSVVNNGALNFARSDAYTYSGVISGSGSVLQYGTGTLSLTGANTYTGATTIKEGTLIGDISKSANVTITGTYDLNGAARTLVNPSGAGTVKSSGSNATLTLTSKNDSTFSGTIENTISSLTVNGPKTLILSGNNAYTGATTVDTGATLVGNISNSTSVTIAGTYDLKGTEVTLTNLSGTGTIQSSGGTGATLTLASPTSENSATFSGTLANTINGLVKTGSGTLILSGTNSMASSTVTTINAGTLQVGSGSTTGSISSNSTVNNGILSFNRSNDYTYSGIISGSGTLIQKGSGKTLLRGSNTYTGSTTLSSGTLNIASANNLGSGAIILSGGILQANADLTLTQPITLTADGTIATSNYSVTVSSNITGTNALRKNGSGTLIFTGTNAYTGITNITAGTLQIGSGSTSGSIASGSIVNSGNFTFNRSDTVTYPGVISGTGTFTKSGTGTVILSGANTYAGSTTISGGTLQIGSGATTGNITSATIINNAALTFKRSDAYAYTGVISGTGALQQSGAGTLTLPGANTYTGSTTIDAGKTLIGNISSSVGVSIAGTYDLNGIARTLTDPSGSGTIQSSSTNAALTLTSKNDSTFSGTIARTISSLTINGSKTLTLPKISTYTGAITINNGAALIGDISNASSVTVNGTYDLNGTAQTVNNLSGGGNIKNSNKEKKETLNIKSKNDTTFSGTLDNNLNSIVKNGSGTVTLAAETGYTGEFVVSEGTLSLTKTSALRGIINLSEKAILSINVTGESTFSNPINFSSTTMSDTPATIKVNKPTTFSGPITCNAPSDKAGRLIISGGHPVTLTGKHMGNFAIILSGEGTSVIIKDEANTNTEIVTGSTWFLLNKEKS